MRLTTSDAPSPLGPFDTHASAHAPPPSPPMARQRQHTTPPPSSAPTQQRRRQRQRLPPSPAPHAPTSHGERHFLSSQATRRARRRSHPHPPPSPHTAHQQWQHTTAPPMTSPRVAPASPITGIDPSSMESVVQPPDDALDDDGTNPAPTGDSCVDVGAVAKSSVTATRKRKGRSKHSSVAQDERKRQRRAALLLATQGDTEAGT